MCLADCDMVVDNRFIDADEELQMITINKKHAQFQSRIEQNPKI